MTFITYKLDAFQGPLDLLLHLIQKAEVCIQDICIREITDQFVHYLRSVPPGQLERTSEFVVMATTLLWMKSKLLLPKPPPDIITDEDAAIEEEYSREQLIFQLEQYRKYKRIAQHLRQCEADYSLLFSKQPEELQSYAPSSGLPIMTTGCVYRLGKALHDVLHPVIDDTPAIVIPQEELCVKTRIHEISMFLQKQVNRKRIVFSQLLRCMTYRQEVIVTFLAVLEMTSKNEIFCYQAHLFDDIVVEWRGASHHHE